MPKDAACDCSTNRRTHIHKQIHAQKQTDTYSQTNDQTNESNRKCPSKLCDHSTNKQINKLNKHVYPNADKQRKTTKHKQTLTNRSKQTQKRVVEFNHTARAFMAQTTKHGKHLDPNKQRVILVLYTQTFMITYLKCA